jgi:hypothetical protein
MHFSSFFLLGLSTGLLGIPIPIMDDQLDSVDEPLDLQSSVNSMVFQGSDGQSKNYLI